MQNLSKHTVNDLGFNLIKKSLIELSLCKDNYLFFKDLNPTTKIDDLIESNNFTDAIYNLMLKKIDADINPLNSLKSTLSNLNIKGSILNEENFKDIYTLILIDQKLKSLFSKKEFKNWKQISKYHSDKKWLSEIEKKFDTLSFNIKKNASSLLLKLYKSRDNIESNIQSKIKEKFEYAKNKNWLQDENVLWINERFALPIKVSCKNKINGIIHKLSSSSKTAFVEPIELVELNNLKNQTEFEITKEKKKILSDLTNFLYQHKHIIQSVYSVILKYDQHLVITKYALSINAIKPNFTNDFEINIKHAFNPLLKEKVSKHVELNFEMSPNTNIIIISGPNTGGKTVVLKSLGLYALMAQSGLFIPAKYVKLPIFKNILTDIGDKQSIETGLSTFSSHLVNIKSIIKQSNEKSLILLDELGSGTDPNSSMAIAQSILEILNKKNCKTITTTHLTNLKNWAANTDKIENSMMKFDYANLNPTYEFCLGMPGSSYALEISDKIGLPKKIINRAKELIGKDTIKIENILKNIQDKEIEINSIKKKLNLELKKVETEKNYHINSKKKLNQKQKNLEYKKNLENETYIKLKSKEIDKIIENIKLTNASRESIKHAKNIIKNEIELIKNKQNSIKNSNITKVDKNDLIKGKYFLINSLNLIGIVDSKLSTNNKLYLKVEDKRIKVDYSNLSYLEKSQIKPSKNYKSNIKLNVSNLDSNKIDLRGLNADEAIDKLDYFIDSAYLNNLGKIIILHGTGEGILKNAVHQYLETQNTIKKFNLAPIDSGGYGVTEVLLK